MTDTISRLYFIFSLRRLTHQQTSPAAGKSQTAVLIRGAGRWKRQGQVTKTHTHIHREMGWDVLEEC